MSFDDSVLIVLLAFPHSDYREIYRFPHGLNMSVDEFGDIELMDNGVVRDTLQLDIVPGEASRHVRVFFDANSGVKGQTIWAHSFEYNMVSFHASNERNIIVEHAAGRIEVTITDTPCFAAFDVTMMLVLVDFSGSDRRDVHRFRRRMSMDINESGDIVLTDKGVVRNEMKLEITSGEA
ncbi:hypothetical protein DXG01_015236 [Tephrocybe rancida]|nr:hypothetical protein DXG01_015236 [Tephrocybe rancida]